jgi:hypothetical protein
MSNSPDFHPIPGAWMGPIDWNHKARKGRKDNALRPFRLNPRPVE